MTSSPEVANLTVTLIKAVLPLPLTAFIFAPALINS